MTCQVAVEKGGVDGSHTATHDSLHSNRMTLNTSFGNVSFDFETVFMKNVRNIDHLKRPSLFKEANYCKFHRLQP